MPTKGTLHKSRFLEVFGMIFDLRTVRRQEVPGEDEMQFAKRIADINATIKQNMVHDKPTTVRRATWFVHKAGVDGLSKDNRNVLGGACHLMVVDSFKDNWSISPWSGLGLDCLLYVNDNEVYTKYRDANEMNHHFLPVSIDVVNAYTDPLDKPAPPIMEPPVVEPPVVVPPVIPPVIPSIPGEINMNVKVDVYIHNVEE